MKMVNKLLASAVCAVMSVAAVPALADPLLLNGSGSINGSTFSLTLDLDVVNGQAQSGTGTISFLSYVDAPLSLITTSTYGNEEAGGPAAPVGFRANDGTDIFGADQSYPLTEAGLLFAVGTTTPMPGQNPVLNLFSSGGKLQSLFDGNVDGTEHYVEFGSLQLSQTSVAAAVPEPGTWGMMILGFGVVGFAMRRKQNVATRVSYAA